MLVARRDPPFDGDPHDAAPYSHKPYAAARAPRLARFVTVIQMVGSVLAVPVGIASAYSFYRANFSPETTCQNLRGGIVAMLDKNVDVSTRRVLVRRDVEEFEKSCATVDPEATAAFKTLLEGEKVKTPAAAAATPSPVAPKAQHVEAAPKEAVRKVEPRPQQVARQPAPSAAVANTDTAQRDPGVSDTQWLDAVRQALVTHKPDGSLDKPEPRVVEPAKPQTTAESPVRPAQREAVAPPPAAALPPPSISAPALPPAIAIAPPAPPPADADHPVPPGSIPDSVKQADDVGVAKPAEAGRSRIRKWISEIPLLGPVVENGRQ